MAQTPDASWHETDLAPTGHIRGVAPLTQHPNARRGQPGSMPLGMTKRLSGAFHGGIPESTDTLTGEATSGAAQAAAGMGGYSGESGGGAATDSGAAVFSAVAPVGSGTASTGQDSSVFEAGSPPANPAGSPWASTSTGGTAARTPGPVGASTAVDQENTAQVMPHVGGATAV